MTPADAELRARTFRRGVRRISDRLAAQPLSELRDSTIDDATRKTLAGLARSCEDLLNEHQAQWVLAALIGLDPEIELIADVSGATPPAREVTKETLLDWLDLLISAFEDLYEPREEGRLDTTRSNIVSVRVTPHSLGKHGSPATGRDKGELFGR